MVRYCYRPTTRRSYLIEQDAGAGRHVQAVRDATNGQGDDLIGLSQQAVSYARTRMPEDQFIDPQVAQRRLEALIDLRLEIQAEINRGEVGRTVEVLVEKEARGEGQMLGRTRRNKVVAFTGEPSLVGQYVQVTLDDTTGTTFVGTQVHEPALVDTA